MKLNERPSAGKAVIVAPAGNIDMATARALEESLVPFVKESAKRGQPVVMDFAAIDYISSAGLRVLMLAAKEAKAGGSQFAVAGLKPLVAEIFEITKFNKVIACHPGVDEALAAVAPAS